MQIEGVEVTGQMVAKMHLDMASDEALLQMLGELKRTRRKLFTFGMNGNTWLVSRLTAVQLVQDAMAWRRHEGITKVPTKGPVICNYEKREGL